MRRVIALVLFVLPAFLVDVINLLQLAGSGCVSSRIKTMDTQACGFEGYLQIFEWFAFGSIMAYLIWTHKKLKS